MISAGNILKFTRSTCMAHLLDLVIAKDSIPKVDELAGLVKKLQEIVKFFRFKGAEVTKKQKEIAALLEKMPPIYDEEGDVEEDVNDGAQESGGAESSMGAAVTAQAIQVGSN